MTKRKNNGDQNFDQQPKRPQPSPAVEPAFPAAEVPAAANGNAASAVEPAVPAVEPAVPAAEVPDAANGNAVPAVEAAVPAANDNAAPAVEPAVPAAEVPAAEVPAAEVPDAANGNAVPAVEAAVPAANDNAAPAAEVPDAANGNAVPAAAAPDNDGAAPAAVPAAGRGTNVSTAALLGSAAIAAVVACVTTASFGGVHRALALRAVGAALLTLGVGRLSTIGNHGDRNAGQFVNHEQINRNKAGKKRTGRGG